MSCVWSFRQGCPSVGLVSITKETFIIQYKMWLLVLWEGLHFNAGLFWNFSVSCSGNNTSLALESCPLLQKCAGYLTYVCLAYVHVVLKSGTCLASSCFRHFSLSNILKLHSTIFHIIFIIYNIRQSQQNLVHRSNNENF